jgi:hypothetical protein
LCFARSGTKPVFFQWNKNGNLLSNSPQTHYKIETSDVESQSLLKIQSVNRNDAGNYSCEANNAFGSDIQHTLLIIEGFT